MFGIEEFHCNKLINEEGFLQISLYTSPTLTVIMYQRMYGSLCMLCTWYKGQTWIRQPFPEFQNCAQWAQSQGQCSNSKANAQSQDQCPVPRPVFNAKANAMWDGMEKLCML